MDYFIYLSVLPVCILSVLSAGAHRGQEEDISDLLKLDG